ncbi:hypothetical protein C2S52_001546 [Perilla frutescens var. hirtella]|nr:hypothetical protein C2S52_001546 [Perilla frutescens var. hirtella]
MRKQLCVEVFSKITRNGSPKSSAFPKSTSNPFHQRSLSHYSTLSRSNFRKICSPNAVSGTMRNGGFPSFVLTRRFFSNALLKGGDKFPVTFRNRKFLHSFRSLDSGRRRSDSRWFTTDEVVGGLIMTNVAVFILWNVADIRFMMKNFMVMAHTIKSGRLHTVITSAFSHIDPFDLMGNIIGIYLFGTSIGRIFGPEYLLKLYLTGGIAASIFHLAYHVFIAPQPSESEIRRGFYGQNTPGLTASGALNAIMLLDIFLCPNPIPSILLGILVVSHDVRSVLQGNELVSGAAHLGGATVAALAWLQNRKGRFRRF